MTKLTIVKSQLRLSRPSDFIKQATEHGATVRNGHGSRTVVQFKGRTIGFSNHGDKEYPANYRNLLVKAFIAAGLVMFICLALSSLPLL